MNTNVNNITPSSPNVRSYPYVGHTYLSR